MNESHGPCFGSAGVRPVLWRKKCLKSEKVRPLNSLVALKNDYALCDTAAVSLTGIE